LISGMRGATVRGCRDRFGMRRGGGIGRWWRRFGGRLRGGWLVRGRSGSGESRLEMLRRFSSTGCHDHGAL
jgi:hypothetical protein